MGVILLPLKQQGVVLPEKEINHKEVVVRLTYTPLTVGYFLTLFATKCFDIPEDAQILNVEQMKSFVCLNKNVVR